MKRSYLAIGMMTCALALSSWAALAQDAPAANVKLTGDWICRYFPSPEAAEDVWVLHPKKVQEQCRVTLGFPTITLCPAYEPAVDGDEQLDDTLECSTPPGDGGSPSQR